MNARTLRPLGAAALAILLSATSAFAAPVSESPFSVAPDAVDPNTGRTPAVDVKPNLKLIASALEGDNQQAVLPQGDANIGVPIKIKCTQACTITALSTIQMFVSSLNSPNQFWAICSTIDGQPSVAGCAKQDPTTLVTGAPVAGTVLLYWNLPAGTHTFQAVVETIGGSYGLDRWSTVLSQYY